MAKPIKETPVLTGEDAVRFLESADCVVPVSQQEKDRIAKAYKDFELIADFQL